MSKDLPGIEGAGVAPVRIAEIDDLAERYIKERDKRCAMTPKELAAKSNLTDAMHRHAEELGRDSDGVIRYQYDDLVVELRPGKEVLKVKTNDQEEE